MPIAAIAFDFDPFLRFGDGAIRLETLGIAIAVLVAIVVAARIALRTLAGPDPDEGHLRIDDLVFIALGVVPGAVVGARLGYVLVHLDFYGANSAAILDPGQGGLELTLAAVGGTLTGALGARLLGEPVRRWLHVAALPLLVGIALGKLALALGGEGQGAPSATTWATSYRGAGPWGSLAPAIASHPAQLYEAAATVVVLVLLMAAVAGGVFRDRDGRAFTTALAAWALARGLVATIWRDPPVLGPLNAEQLLSGAVIAGCGVVAVVLARRPARSAAERDPEWREAGVEQPL
ncbi:MAG TPA: prolipoprotein diacylglyceryl transferase family protein [Candidatus Limnocylindrales bacterium]|nr:prolipoprotein diacylglyceryl transferase family protein [Candidatus Limnocylindrales bacterium]